MIFTEQLPFTDRGEWRWRWMYSDGGAVIHRIARVDHREQEEWVGVDGQTVCGYVNRFHMPGVMNRLEGQRCKRCCRILGIEEGYGAPSNQDIDA